MDDERETRKIYLGDGVWLQNDPRGGHVLTTQKARRTTNEIFLDRWVLNRFLDVLRVDGYIQ